MSSSERRGRNNDGSEPMMRELDMQTVRRPRPGRWRRAGAAVLVSGAVVSAVTGCGLAGLDGPQFSVGDCVRVEDRVLDSDLNEASCADAVGTFDSERRIYRVDSIIDNTGGGCPALQGFFPVEFVLEPDGVTYCLVQES